ncbi:MAG: nuclear transport factor 2 family protein [Chitinophagaceae bacterium]|nr:MAG: nuclear transport factor 2 family protein [Chitinophagaceae bacterium]
MKPILFKSFFISFLFLSIALNKSYCQPAFPNNDIELLKKMEYDWLMAEFKLDTAAIAAMMDERFMAIGLAGVSNKQQELSGIYENMQERLKDKHIVDSLYFDDIHVQIFENTAIVTFISVTKGRIKEVPFVNRRTRMYDVWVKRDGKWKAVSSQVSPIR